MDPDTRGKGNPSVATKLSRSGVKSLQMIDSEKEVRTV